MTSGLTPLIFSQRIRQWYNNHTRLTAAASERRRTFLDLTKRVKRQKSDWQTYSTLYYHSKLKSIIAERWKAKYEDEHPDRDPSSQVIPGPTLAYRNEQIRLLYQDESEAVKQEVEAKMKEEDNDQDAVDEGEGDRGIDPEEGKQIVRLRAYQRSANTVTAEKLTETQHKYTFRARDSIPMTVSSMLEQVKEQTGLIGTVMFAGPDLEQGGSIYSIT
jgi:hypothetical protein